MTISVHFEIFILWVLLILYWAMLGHLARSRQVNFTESQFWVLLSQLFEFDWCLREANNYRWITCAEQDLFKCIASRDWLRQLKRSWLNKVNAKLIWTIWFALRKAKYTFYSKTTPYIIPSKTIEFAVCQDYSPILEAIFGIYPLHLGCISQCFFTRLQWSQNTILHEVDIVNCMCKAAILVDL